MVNWLTPDIAVLLMLLGVIPSLGTVYLLYDERHKPGVLWFLVSMGTGGLWAFLFAMITLIPSPTITLVLANFFWAVVPIAAVSMFLLAYEFVFKNVVSRRFALAMFSPIVALFLLTWINPSNLVFTADYYVDADGFLRIPLPGGVIRLLIVQIYGYVLVFLAAGMFVGETMRTSGIQRRQTIYLLFVFSALVVSTMIKVAGLVPIYYDPTSTVYAFSGLLFAFSIRKHGLLKFSPIAREQTFEEVNDTIIVVDPARVVVDINRSGRQLFGTQIVGKPIEEILLSSFAEHEGDSSKSIQLDVDGEQRYFSLRTSSIRYGRGSQGKIVVLSDVSALKEREKELNLLKEILSRVFRHNIRNDLTAINGYTELIKERGDDHVVELADEIMKKSSHLVNQAEKVRMIEKIITQDHTVTGPLQEIIDQAVSTYRPQSNVVIRTTSIDAIVEFHPKLHLAIQELIENTIVHHEAAETPEIDIYTELQEHNIVLFVEDNGPGIPQSEIDVLHAEEETNLEHSSGIGLWLVRWIVDHSNGELMAETTGEGTRIGIRLSRADTKSEDAESLTDR